MKDLQNISFDNLSKIYNKYFTLGYISADVSEKLACISLICYITNELRKKGKNVTCYDVLLQIGKNSPEFEKNTFLKSLGAICEDLMYGCNIFPDFNIKPKDMPSTVKKLLDKYVPF